MELIPQNLVNKDFRFLRIIFYWILVNDFSNEFSLNQWFKGLKIQRSDNYP